MISFLLTCDKTKERLQSCIDGLSKIGIFPTLVNGPDLEDGKTSCFLGHINILNQFIQSGENYCLVLEDDCIIEQPINYDLVYSIDFEIFLLGAVILKKEWETEEVIKVKNFLHTHSFIITKEAAKKSLKLSQQLIEENKIPHIDFFYTENLENIKCLKNTITRQNYNFKSKIIKRK